MLHAITTLVLKAMPVCVCTIGTGNNALYDGTRNRNMKISLVVKNV